MQQRDKLILATHKELKKRKDDSIWNFLKESQFFLALFLILNIIIFGSVGYVVVEDWPLLDALYMTIMTITTVGYGEVHTLTAMGRIFTIILMIFSFAVVGYSIRTLASSILEGELNRVIRGRRMDKKIANLKEHYILCGGGNTGRSIAEEFFKTEVPFVLVEKSEECLKHIATIGDIPYIDADATQDETLILAGIENARGIITVLSEDKDNVFVVLSARALNPGLRIVARVIDENNHAKLKKAGADEIVSPNQVGGLRMASVMMRPEVVNFLDAMLHVTGNELRLEELAIQDDSFFSGKTLASSNIGKETGLLVVAIRKFKGKYKFNPGSNTMIKPGDHLIVMGTEEQLSCLKKLERF
ncbi:potassium channel family protein [Candidatus Riflebacteria bacterium]